MRKMYDEATRKRWQEATCKAIKDGEDHARLLHNIIKRCRERYGSLAHYTHFDELVVKWKWVERKCRAKAEEYVK